MSAPTPAGQSTKKVGGFIQEFKEFVLTGDLMTIAVAFIMAALIKDVITSFINDIFNGVLGLFIGDCKTDPDTKKQTCTVLSDKAWKGIQYGSFLNTLFTFVITAFVVFLLIKAYRKATGRGLATDGPGTNDILLEIRDELRQSRNA
jgi:large conductance mechanosensitive channel